MQGMAHTRGALSRWNADPAPVVRGWTVGSLGYACLLLGAVTIVATLVRPDLTPVYVPGLDFNANLGDYGRVVLRNGLVLALHAVACVAGFIAGSSLPLQAAEMTGWRRWVHERARPVAFAWVIAVTCFSLVTQAYILGSHGAQLANSLNVSPALLVLTVLPHAMVELTAVFLPLAAWTIASRNDDWQDLLAATLATVAIAVPMLLIAASWETWGWPLVLGQISPVA